MPLDSVFSPFLDAHTTRNSEFASEFKVPFEDDEPILARKVIEEDTDAIAEKYEGSIARLVRNRILEVVDSLKGADEKKINRLDLNLRPQLSQLIWGIWSDGWLLGQDHGNREIDKLESERKFSLGDRLAEFRKKKNPKDRRDVFQPDDIATRRTGKPQRVVIPQEKLGRGKKVDLRRFPLKGSYMEQAVRDRADAVSNWFSDDLGEQIKDVMRRRAVGDPILGRKLTDLEARQEIAGILDGSDDDEERKRTQRVGGIEARAKRLAKTETTGVYTLGRLHSYKERGIEFVRYHTFEYIRGLLPGLRPCMVCLPKNGHILNLQTQWDLIVTDYLVPAHPHCKCYWLPILKEDGQALLAADVGRSPRKGVGKAIAGSWMGFTVEGGRLVMNQALKREMERREQTRRRQKMNRVLMTGGAVAFSAMLYTFFQEWRRRQGGAAPGIVFTPESIRDSVISTLENVTVATTAAAAESAIEKLLAPAIISKLAGTNTPAGQLGVSAFRALGMNQQEAATAYGALQMFLEYMKKHGPTTVGGLDLNAAGVDDLMATGMFSRKKAEAIAAYTRAGGKLDSLEDLNKVRFPNSRRTAFNTLEINRLQLYYARKNLNDSTLFDLNNVQAAEQLYQDLGVNRGTGEIILREMRQGGSFRNVGDMAARLKGKLDARTIKSVIQKLDQAGYKVVSPELDLLPRLDVLRQPDLLQYPFPVTGTAPLRSLPGAPPSVTSPTIPSGTPPVQAQQLRGSFLRQRPENLIQQAARVDRGMTKLLPKRLREQVLPQQIAAAQAVRDRASQQNLAYQRYSERVADLLDSTRNAFSPETVQGLIDYEPSSLASLTVRVDGNLLSLDGAIKRLEALDGQSVTREVELNDVYNQLQEQIQTTEVAKSITTTQLQEALNRDTKAAREVKAQQDSLVGQVDQYREEALSRRDEFLDPQNYLRDSIQLNQTVQQLEALKDLQRSQVIQDLQVEIDQLRDLQASLIRDTQGVKGAISAELERLRTLKLRIEQAQRAANLSMGLRDRLAEFWQ